MWCMSDKALRIIYTYSVDKHLCYLCIHMQAPHGPSQQALIMTAMQRAGVSFLPYVASHGTGTPLGE